MNYRNKLFKYLSPWQNENANVSVKWLIDVSFLDFKTAFYGSDDMFYLAQNNLGLVFLGNGQIFTAWAQLTLCLQPWIELTVMQNCTSTNYMFYFDSPLPNVLIFVTYLDSFLCYDMSYILNSDLLPWDVLNFFT